MIIQLLLASLIGVCFGCIGMAILVSSRNAENREREIILHSTLDKVWNWYCNKRVERFPVKDVQKALSMN